MSSLTPTAQPSFPSASLRTARDLSRVSVSASFPRFPDTFQQPLCPETTCPVYQLTITRSGISREGSPPPTVTETLDSALALEKEEGSHDPQGKPQDADNPGGLRKIVCLVILPSAKGLGSLSITGCPGATVLSSEDPRVSQTIKVEAQKGETPEDYRKKVESALKLLTGVEISFDALKICAGSKNDAAYLQKLLALPTSTTIDIDPQLPFMNPDIDAYKVGQAFLYGLIPPVTVGSVVGLVLWIGAVNDPV
jgi:hypothetical protein